MNFCQSPRESLRAMFLQSLAGLAVGAALPAAVADVVTDWNRALLETTRVECTAPPLAARHLAMVHAAIYDAVNSVRRTHQPYRWRLDAPAEASAEAAAVGAAHEVAVGVCPGRRAYFDVLLQKSLATMPHKGGSAPGIAFGRRVGQLMLEWRSNDGASTTMAYIPHREPGQWLRTAPFFRPPELTHWVGLTPFAMTNRGQFRPSGPPALTDERFAADFAEVKSLGALHSAVRTVEQTEIARFWSDFSFTVTPPGHWNQIAEDVARQRKLNLAETARLFAVLNVALADAAIVAWDAKYHYNFWRPITAIHEAGHDSNPGTVGDPDWRPLLTTPAFPEYVSGHSAFSGAAAEVLAAFTGSDQATFTVSSDTLPGVTRTFHSFRGAAEEIGMSRIYGGIHYGSSNRDGLAAGRALAAFVVAHQFRPVSDLAGR